MGNFYKIFSILNERRKNYNFYLTDVLLGEDDDSPFYAVVDITHIHSPEGEYEPESFDVEIEVEEFGDEALSFKKPGRHLEKVPSPMRQEGLKWLENEIEEFIERRIKDIDKHGDRWNESVSSESEFLKIYERFVKEFPVSQQENPMLYEKNFYIGAIASVLDELSETDKFWDMLSPTLNGLKQNYKKLRNRLFKERYPEAYEMWLKEQS